MSYDPTAASDRPTAPWQNQQPGPPAQYPPHGQYPPQAQYGPPPQYPPPAQYGPVPQYGQPDAQRQALAQSGVRGMAVGAALFVLGLAITVITVLSRSPIYLVAWGPMLWGVIRFIRGARALSRSRR